MSAIEPEAEMDRWPAATNLRLVKKKSGCVRRRSGRWRRQRLASLDHPSVNQFVAGNRATVMGHQRLRFEGVARLERLFGLPVHLEHEVALVTHRDLARTARVRAVIDFFHPAISNYTR